MFWEVDQLGRHYVPTVIHGKPVAQGMSQLFPVTSGLTGQTHYAQNASVDIAIQAMEAAATAHKTWKTSRVSHRQALLNKVADILERRIDDASYRAVLETSCTKKHAEYDVKFSAIMVRETASALSSICGKIPPSR